MAFLFQIAFMVLLIWCASSQKNIANTGTAYQSSTYNWGSSNGGFLVASLAITGGPTHNFYSESCATTATHPTRYVAWWMLAFPVDTVYITNVRIYYRSNTPQRLAGYSLYVSNSSISKTDGYLCYHDEGPGLPSVDQDRDCNHLGQYVIIYNERNVTSNYNPAGYSLEAVLELCEVEIYGCYKTWFGTNCESRCSLKCIDRHCYPGNGTCVWGCNCLRDTNCDVSTACNEGCEKGYAGRFCNYYNLASNKVATQYPSIGQLHAELSNDGDKATWSCSRTSGSQAWWQVDLGDISTITAIYITYQYTGEIRQRGDGHSLYVSSTSGQWTDGILLNLTSTFHNSFPFINYLVDPVVLGRYITYVPPIVNGIAYVDICEVEVVGCPVGTYGNDCNQMCPQNCLRSCHPDTGLCVLGCNDGWDNQYNNCNKTCDSPRFGRNCENYCYCFNNHACDHVSGTCPGGGCQKGWEGTSCSAECTVGRFGYNCNESCDGCLMDSCDSVNGVCTNTNGCRPGWKPEIDKCDIACDDGYFGDCASICHCRTGICAKTTGMCPNDQCDEGWKGSTCSEECNEGYFGFDCDNYCDRCSNVSCDRLDGNCTYGCIEGFKGHQCHIADQVKRQEPVVSDPIPAIGGGIGAGIVVLILILIVVFFLRRRSWRNTKANDHGTRNLSGENIYINNPRASFKKGNDEKTKFVDSMADEDNIQICIAKDVEDGGSKSAAIKTDYVYSKPLSDEYVDVGDVYTNVPSEQIASRYKIQLEDLQHVISERRKNNDAGFKDEYEVLPKGLVRPHIEGSKEENKVKNRFLTTWPYDHSRVILQDKDSSDYINASYIDSYSKEKDYIATQGPKKNTIKDFWHMVWQEKVEIIVMVTKLEEDGRKKCDQYWPENSTTSISVGQHNVSLITEQEHTVYVYRKIKMSNAKMDKSERIIHHFHFTQWPDHGVPDKIKLVTFYRKVRHVRKSLNGPMVVHCSAGIGRTGTFIAIDALYENGQKTGYIDIMEYVQMMRKDRMNMIQTKDQYITVFESLLEVCTVPDTAIDKDDFCSHLENEDNSSQPANQASIRLEFQKLQDLKQSYSDESFKSAKAKDNVSKNVDATILPNDNYRPFLMSFESARNDYINAVIIPEYTGNKRCFVTQYPLEDTVVDFWTLVYDTDSTIVVLLESVNECVPLLPQHGGEFDFQKLHLKHSTDSSLSALNFKLNHKEKNEHRDIRVICMDDWNVENIPSSEKCMLDLLSDVSSWREQRPGSVVVVCRDGCKKSGVFVALSLVLEKMKMDDEVDIFQVVRTIQIRRPEFVSNFDQYEYCYQCIKCHLDGDSLYANI